MYIQRYLTDSLLTEAASKVRQVLQKADDGEKTYKDHLEEYAAECSFVYSGDMLLNYCVQKFLPTTKHNVAEACLSMTINQRSSLSNEVGLAEAEGKTYRARTMTYGRTPTPWATRQPVMPTDNSSTFERDGYSTEASMPLQWDTSPLLLMPTEGAYRRFNPVELSSR